MVIQAIIAALAMSPPPSVTVVPANISPTIGSCSTAKNSIDLDKLLFIESDSVVIQEPLKTLQITLEKENVKIVDLKPRRDGFYITNISYEVSPKDDLDVELKFGLISNELVLYWKETYKHQIYRQGLFSFLNGRPIALCEGRGGASSE